MSYDINMSQKGLDAIFEGRIRMLIDAPSESGKTQLAIKMLLNPKMVNYRKYYKIYIIAPFFYQDEKYGIFQDILETEEREYEVFLRYSDGIVAKIQKDVAELRNPKQKKSFMESMGFGEKQKKKDKPENRKFLIILDDIAGEKGVRSNAVGSDQSLNRLSYMGRHWKIDYICMVQSVSALSGSVWDNSNILIFFDTLSGVTLKVIHEHVGRGMKYGEFIQMWEYVMEQPFSFLLVNKRRTIKMEDRFYKKFSLLKIKKFSTK